MATFTMPLKEVIEFTDGTINYETVEFEGIYYHLPVMSGGNIGLNHYPIFDEGYRNILTGKIIDRFWNREIGMETIDDFHLAMRRRMNEIMPFYNKLYESERIEYTALSTMDVRTESTNTATSHEEGEATATNNSESDSESRAVNSTTPQTMLAGNKDYASGASDVNSWSGVENTSEQNNVADSSTVGTGDSRTSGYQGVASDLIMRYRDSLLNVDLMVLRDLEDCFMSVLNNGDAYTQNGWYFS